MDLEKRVGEAEVRVTEPTLPAAANPLTHPSLRRFFWALAVTVTLIIAAAWAWAINGRMYFFNPEYSMWTAKFRIVDQCAAGDTIVIGDSRAMAGILPERLGSNVTNLALPGGTPIESYYLLRHLDHCAVYPKRAVVSFLPLFLKRVHMYWLRPTLYNFMSCNEMEEVRRTSVQLNDPVLYSSDRIATVLDRIKNYSYCISLPSYYFSAMVNGGFFARHARNDIELERTLANHGQHFFGMAEKTPAVAEDGYMQAFNPSAVLDHYMSAVLQLLDDHDVIIDFVGTPINPATFEALPPSVTEAFRAYLASIEQRYAHFHVRGDIVRVLPDDDFGDLEHLNPRGAEEWTASVRALFDDAPQ